MPGKMLGLDWRSHGTIGKAGAGGRDRVPTNPRLGGFWVARCRRQKWVSDLKSRVCRPGTETSGVWASLLKSTGLTFGGMAGEVIKNNNL